MATPYSWILVEPSGAELPEGADTTGAGELARNLRLDPLTGDLSIVGGQLQLVGGLEAIAQDLRCRLKTFRGEWFLREDLGVPYFEEVLRKNPQAPAVRAIFRREILAVPGIRELLELRLDYDRATRGLTVAIVAATDLGELRTTVEV